MTDLTFSWNIVILGVYNLVDTISITSISMKVNLEFFHTIHFIRSIDGLCQSLNLISLYNFYHFSILVCSVVCHWMRMIQC